MSREGRIAHKHEMHQSPSGNLLVISLAYAASADLLALAKARPPASLRNCSEERRGEKREEREENRVGRGEVSIGNESELANRA